LAAIFTLFLTPVAYLLIARFSSSASVEKDRINKELSEVSNDLI
jgi:hypothetical protein